MNGRLGLWLVVAVAGLLVAWLVTRYGLIHAVPAIPSPTRSPR